MDEPEKGQDGPEGGTSVATKETSELVKAAELKGKSDALSDVNRTLAEAKKATKASEAAEKRVTQMLKDYEEDIKDEPARLTAYQARQVRNRAESELDSVTQERDELQEKVQKHTETEAESKKEQTAKEVAGRLEVNPKQLAKLAKFSDGSVEAIEDIAKVLPKLNPSEPLIPDTNRSAGGGQSEEQIRKNYRENPDDPSAKTDYLAWRRTKGI